ncbi:hypothetical protein CIB93_04570 [Streptomyces sp. WZ.A104]|uniref:DUF11 domain-containing protein n=1 Tax=unclassified Streptomyces TaxID=2593676 RepID=UPI000BBBA1D8|nr:DUF11 domain-containing protein [Streptomyces sp. WZ.A104]PCG87125.1 hypothetical protein CIB93_04570 [Streptomyces sp. WZ.A104]
MYLKPTRTLRRRAAAALLAASAVGGVSLAVAAPASAAYGGDYAKSWVDRYANPDYAKNWTDAYNKNHGKPWGGGVPDVPVAKADVAVTASGPANIDHNEEQLWEVKVTNLGKATAQQVRAEVTLPNGIGYRAHRISQGDATAERAADGRIQVAVGALEPGESVILQIAGRGPSYGGGNVQLTAKVTTTSAESNTGNNTATVATRIA